MSTLSIINKDREYYQEYFEKQRLHWADKNWVYNHFRVGEKENSLKIQHNLIMFKVFCNDNCSVINFIHDKLNGKLEKRCHRKPLKDKIHQYKKECGLNCSDEEAINHCCEISNIVNPKW